MPWKNLKLLYPFLCQKQGICSSAAAAAKSLVTNSVRPHRHAITLKSLLRTSHIANARELLGVQILRSTHSVTLYVNKSSRWLWCTLSLVQFSGSVMSDSLRRREPQHARPPCPSPTPGVHPNPCPLNRWCHPTISSSVIPFSSCPQSFSALGSFQMSQLSASGGQSVGASASTSVFPMNTQDWSPLGWTGWISLQSKGLSRVFSNTTLQKHQFFSSQLSL